MLIINSFVGLGLINNPYYLALALLIIIVLAYLSWVFIEKKALKLKKIKLFKKKNK